MTFLFFALYVPVVVLLGLIGFVVSKLCDRVADMEARADDIELVDDARFAVEMAQWNTYPVPDRRRQQLDVLTRMFDRTVTRRTH